MRLSGNWLRPELDVATTGEVGSEFGPLPVEENAAEVQEPLGALSAPAHSGTVEADADEVADSSSAAPLPMSRSWLRISL